MFEKRLTVRSLATLAHARANTLSIRIPLALGPAFRRLWSVGVRLLISFGIGYACAKPPPRFVLPWVGAAGLMILFSRWNRVIRDTSAPPRFFAFYPASAERIWHSRFAQFRLSSLWWLIDALAVISFLAAWRQMSLASAFASIPSAFALAAWLTALPLLLTITFKSIKPGQLFLPIFPLGLLSLFASKAAPQMFEVVMVKLWTASPWITPVGWFFLSEKAAFHPALRVIFGAAAFAVGFLSIRPLSSCLERRMIRKEEDADASDATATRFEAPLAEARVDRDRIPQPIATSLGLARTQLESHDWATFPAPQALLERFFWRTLSQRQKLVAKLVWPHGLSWNLHRLLYIRTAATFLAAGAGLRLVPFTPLGSFLHSIKFPLNAIAWFTLAGGALVSLIFAPPLPGWGFVFETLPLGSRHAAICHFHPVSVSEISAIQGRCQTIRAAGACWFGAAYGALSWLIMGKDFRIGVCAGLFLIFISFGFHPLALVAKLSRITRGRGRRWTSLPSFFLLLLAAMFGLAGFLAIIGVIMGLAASAEEAPRSHPSFLLVILVAFAVAAALRLLGWILLKLYIFLIERSWLDAVVDAPKRR